METLRLQLSELVGQVGMATKEMGELRSSFDRFALEQTGVQQRLATLEQKISSAFEHIHETHREARNGRDMASSLKTSMEVVLATLERQAHVLRRLLRRRPTKPKRRPRLKVVRGGRASSPSPAPKRRQ